MKEQWNFLKKIAENKKIPQAIIFSGPDYLPKEETALKFIKLLSCEKENKPCEKCFNCRLINQRNHPDFSFIEPEEKEIYLDQIRELNRKISQRAQISPYKFALINKAETLNSQAQNCFLKTLEEPKGKTLLILLTSQVNSLLDTIRSRCQILRFYPNNFYFKGSKDFEKIAELFDSNLGSKLLFSKRFFEKKPSYEKVSGFLESMENYLHLILLKKLKIKNEKINSFSFESEENLEKIKEIIEKTSEIKRLISKTNLNSRLAFEELILEI